MVPAPEVSNPSSIPGSAGFILKLKFILNDFFYLLFLTLMSVRWYDFERWTINDFRGPKYIRVKQLSSAIMETLTSQNLWQWVLVLVLINTTKKTNILDYYHL